jgi:hypothetical protein
MRPAENTPSIRRDPTKAIDIIKQTTHRVFYSSNFLTKRRYSLDHRAVSAPSKAAAAATAGAPITDAMLAAGEAAFDDTCESLPTRGVVQAVYIAMRAAALRATGGGR